MRSWAGSTKNMHAGLRGLGLLVLALGIVAAMATGALADIIGEAPTPDANAPVIVTDKADYAPGELVTLSGWNWQRDEAIHVYVEDDQGRTWNHDADLTAAADGAFSYGFNLPGWFVATYTVKATGEGSGAATATFTDSNPQSILVEGSSVTVAQGAAASYGTVTVQKGGNSNSCNITLSPVVGGGTGLPAGATAVFGVNPLTMTTDDVSTSLSVTTGAGTPTGTFTFRVAGSNGGECQGPGPTNSEPLTLVITAGTVNTTTTASNATATYGDASVALNATVIASSTVNVGTVTYTVKDGSTTVGSVTSGTVTGGAASASFPLSGVNANSYTIEAAYSGGTGLNPSNNSTQSPTPTLTVSKKSLTGSFTADDKTYDGTTAATILTRSVAGKIGTEDVTLTGGSATFDTKDVGTDKTVTATGFTLGGADKDNYSLAAGPWTTAADITPAELTVSASSHEVFVGGPVPTIEPSYGGWVLVEGVDDLDLTGLVCGTDYTTLSGVGGYDTWCDGAVSDNYSFTYVDGTVTVHYNFGGFLEPMKSLPTKNQVKAGRAVPVKFSLDGFHGYDIFAPAGSPRSSNHTCAPAGSDVLEDTITAGSSSLSYDSKTDTYTYVWKTESTWAGKCRTFFLNLKDGSGPSAGAVGSLSMPERDLEFVFGK
jgi:hypothetical protein